MGNKDKRYNNNFLGVCSELLQKIGIVLNQQNVTVVLNALDLATFNLLLSTCYFQLVTFNLLLSTCYFQLATFNLLLSTCLNFPLSFQTFAVYGTATLSSD